MKKIIQDHSSLKQFRFKSLLYSENQFSLLSQYNTGVLHLGRTLIYRQTNATECDCEF